MDKVSQEELQTSCQRVCVYALTICIFQAFRNVLPSPASILTLALHFDGLVLEVHDNQESAFFLAFSWVLYTLIFATSPF